MFAYCKNCPVMFADASGGGSITDIAGKRKEQQDRANKDFSPINGQSTCEYADVAFGKKKMRNNGCTILALYNAQGLTGQATYVPHLIAYFERKGRIRLFGVFPWEIDDYLSEVHVAHRRAKTMKEMNALLAKGGVAVVTFWNSTIAGSFVPDVFRGAHTVALAHDGNGTYSIYNAYNNRSTPLCCGSIEEYIGKGYYYGFYIG